ncbi:hypothetical protein Hypma_006747 [Hypsizygus marmoreus]|uniref:GATA-type domain-containing protein n=1 Tax=Hypsizygus marmoreus TaxID=39966 RepID=A0A369K0R3_HYPMA|nr:hypothetical protein Hypma_006747 [Hypsizygus marmoreus]
MASSTHHPAAQHSRYNHSIPQNSRDEVRLPSIKDLNFNYARRQSQDGSPHNSISSAGPVEPSINSQEPSVRHVQPWARSNPQPQSPSSMSTHPHHQQQQQHTPPLSAGHEPPPAKHEYSSKADNGGFLTPGMPLSAQSTPVPGSVTIGPGTRGDDASSKRLHRNSVSMSAPRDARSPHTAYPPSYASYPPPQPAPPSHYHQIQPPMAHPGHPGQPMEHMHAHQVPVSAHPSYTGYQQHYMSTRVHPQHAPHQPQPPPGNPYPSPGPSSAPPPQGHWEQPQHSQPIQHPPPQHPPPQHPPPQHISPQHQHQTHPHHLPPPQHPQHPQQQAQHPHVIPHHQPPPPPMQTQHHHMHQQAHQAIPPPHAQQHPQSQPQQHAQPQVQQHQQMSFTRTTPIVPTTVDTRSSYPVSEHERMPSARDNTMSEIIKHCSALYSFASRYAQLQQSLPEIYPSQEELSEMSHRAGEVVRLLEEYRRLNLPEAEQLKLNSTVAITPPDDHRPPKRPWEDMAQEDNVEAESGPFSEQQYPTSADKAQSTAEQDMEIIRTKRATSTAGGSGSAGQPKSKYRKRSRATPPGKCHSCNIRETPEWRRGPDGARTLCNACGLHYAKLQRKMDKTVGPNGEVPRIDMETLRASARAADLADKSHGRSKRSQPSIEPISPMESGKPLPQQHHQGSFQLIPMMPQDPSSSAHAEPNRVSSQPHQGMAQSGSMAAPAPPWQTNVPSSAPGTRSYAPDQLQHQSFMRTSHHTSPR